MKWGVPMDLMRLTPLFLMLLSAGLVAALVRTARYLHQERMRLDALRLSSESVRCELEACRVAASHHAAERESERRQHEKATLEMRERLDAAARHHERERDASKVDREALLQQLAEATGETAAQAQRVAELEARLAALPWAASQGAAWPRDATWIVSGGLTNNNAPVLSGNAEPGSTVTVSDGDTVLGTATVGADGSWSFTTGRST